MDLSFFSSQPVITTAEITAVVAIFGVGIGAIVKGNRKTKTVASIVSHLVEVKDELELHAEAMIKKGEFHADKANYHMLQHENASAEHMKARVVSGNIANLIGSAS